MMSENDRYNAIINRLKEEGLRITPQRLNIIRIVTSDKEHPTIDEIYRQVKKDFPTTSLATIYKTVAVLREIGEVKEIPVSDGSNRFDGYSTEVHSHLICTKCKKVVNASINEKIHIVASELFKDYGFKITSHRLDFFGVCPECQKKYNSSKKE